MTVPNIGPELSGPNDPDDAQRGGNSLYRDGTATDDVQAASTRASAITHRFGGVRYALSRDPRPRQPEGGESDENV